MSEMWNKTAMDVTNMSFVTNMEESTVPVGGDNGFGGIQRYEHEKEMVTIGEDFERDFGPTNNYDSDEDEFGGGTIVVDDQIDGKQVKPVVGWFVCTRGEDVGKDFHIYGGYNTIGRSDPGAAGRPTVDLTDKHVSRDAAMVLSYDPLYNEYTLSKVTDSETVCRFNRKMIHGSIELKAYDRVTLGKKEEVELMFIPLCGEQFQWEEDEE